MEGDSLGANIYIHLYSLLCQAGGIVPCCVCCGVIMFVQFGMVSLGVGEERMEHRGDAAQEVQLPEFEIDVDLLREFEKGLDPRHPEAGPIPAHILGYGEITTVFEIAAAGSGNLAYKRLPSFRTEAELDRYRHIYHEYNHLLTEQVGLAIPPHGEVSFSEGGRIICFLFQEKLPSQSIGNRVIHLVPEDQVLLLFRLILRELRKVWDLNRERDRFEIGIDGQISNWAVAGEDAQVPRVRPETRLLYLDTSTPLYRLNGTEQIDTELFLRSAPSFLVWLIRLLFLEDVVTRYYDFRLVTIDLIANFHKEQMPELIPALIDSANDFFAGEAADFGIKPVTRKEVDSYYREDAIIWRLYLGARKVDRFLRTRLTRRGYPYILPGKIKR